MAAIFSLIRCAIKSVIIVHNVHVCHDKMLEIFQIKVFLMYVCVGVITALTDCASVVNEISQNIRNI